MEALLVFHVVVVVGLGGGGGRVIPFGSIN